MPVKYSVGIRNQVGILMLLAERLHQNHSLYLDVETIVPALSTEPVVKITNEQKGYVCVLNFHEVINQGKFTIAYYNAYLAAQAWLTCEYEREESDRVVNTYCVFPEGSTGEQLEVLMMPIINQIVDFMTTGQVVKSN
jgi:hypothetical protein